MRLEKGHIANCIILTLLILSVLGSFACLFINSKTSTIVGLILVCAAPFLILVGGIITIAKICFDGKESTKTPIDEHQIRVSFEKDECERISRKLVINENNKKFEEEYYIKDLTLVPVESGGDSVKGISLIRYAFVDSGNNPIVWMSENTSKLLHEAATKYRLKKVDYDYFINLSLVFDTSRRPKDNHGKICFTLVEDWTKGLDFEARGLIPYENTSEF